MINCCSIRIRPRERNRGAGESDERIPAVAGGRQAPFCTDAEHAALALTAAKAAIGLGPRAKWGIPTAGRAVTM